MEMYTIMVNLRKYNPFPTAVWVFLFLAFVSGFFTGGVYESFALQKNEENTCNFINKKVRKPLLPF